MKKVLTGILLIVCMSCSIIDPDIPSYDSLGKGGLPEIELLSADVTYIWQVSLRMNIKGTNARRPSKFMLCYSKDNELPGITDEVIDLLPNYKNGMVDKLVSDLRPSTLYYCRTYVETSDDSRYSNLLQFKTSALNQNKAWEKVCNFPSENNWYETTAVIGQDVYIRGSVIKAHKDTEICVVWKYTPLTNSWKRIGDFPGGPRTETVMFSIGSRLYMGMGAISVGDMLHYQNDFWEYDPAADSWRRLSDFPKSDSVVMGVFGCKDKGYLISSEEMWPAFPMTVFSYDPVEDLWIKRANFPREKLSETLSIAVRDRFFIFGGAYPSEQVFRFSNALWEYEPGTNTWFRRADFPDTGRWKPMGFAVNDRLYVGYGENIGPNDTWGLVDDLWEYDLSKDSWEIRTPFVAKPFFVSLSFGVGDAGYIGSADLGLWKYMPEEDK